MKIEIDSTDAPRFGLLEKTFCGCLQKSIMMGKEKVLIGSMNMDTKSQAVLEAALALPEAERAEIAAELLATLGPEDDTLADDELAKELERRLEECRQDASTTVPWTALREMP